MSSNCSGLRIALAVDSNIFFANIRPTYTWAYLLNGLVMSYGGSERNRYVRTYSHVSMYFVCPLMFITPYIINLSHNDFKIFIYIESLFSRRLLSSCFYLSCLFVNRIAHIKTLLSYFNDSNQTS